jgi:hypothetical protein
VGEEVIVEQKATAVDKAILIALRAAELITL